MKREERKIQFDVALDIVEKVYKDYCHDPDVNREQVREFNDFVQDMIRFSSVLRKELEENPNT